MDEGRELSKQGRHVEAIRLVEKALTMGEKEFGLEDRRVAIILDNLASPYKGLGEYSKAETLYKRSLTIREKALGPDHPDVARSINNLAVLCKITSNCSNRENLFIKSLAIVDFRTKKVKIS